MLIVYRIVVPLTLIASTGAMASCPPEDFDLGASCIKSLTPSLVGRVISVSDGDTLTLLDDEKKQHKVRLAYVDAPEAGQPHGQASKRNLSRLCFGKAARVGVVDRDRYQRQVGLVECDGVVANREMVRDGYAWIYERYAPRGLSWQGLQSEAKSARRGLWAGRDPVAPWEFRKSRPIE
jgi:endonuclease YncB( thermonuclease family)